MNKTSAFVLPTHPLTTIRLASWLQKGTNGRLEHPFSGYFPTAKNTSFKRNRSEEVLSLCNFRSFSAQKRGGVCRTMKRDSCKKQLVWADFCARWSTFRNTFFCTFSLHFRNATYGDSFQINSNDRFGLKRPCFFLHRKEKMLTFAPQISNLNSQISIKQ